MRLIDAYAAIEAMSNVTVLDKSAARRILTQLPTIERKIGHWVEIGDEPYDEWECDVCGFVIDGSGCIDPLEYLNIYNFCPNCGSRMEGADDV